MFMFLFPFLSFMHSSMHSFGVLQVRERSQLAMPPALADHARHTWRGWLTADLCFLLSVSLKRGRIEVTRSGDEMVIRSTEGKEVVGELLKDERSTVITV